MWSRLQHPPTTDNAATHAKLVELAEYFENTWVNGDFPPVLWSHYDNLGPRTTNHAEGFYNSLNVKLGMPHPSLRAFLNWLQKAQFEVQCKIIQLESGRPAKARQPTYVQNDANMWSAKLQYSMRIGSIFSCLFPHPQAWEEFHTSHGSVSVFTSVSVFVFFGRFFLKVGSVFGIGFFKYRISVRFFGLFLLCTEWSKKSGTPSLILR